MKIMLALAVLFTAESYGQCHDVYGNRTKCPSEKDSMQIYQNAVKVYDYYENNPAYVKLSSREIHSDAEREEVFDMLKQARKLFYVIRHEVANMRDDLAKQKGLRKELAKDIHFWDYYDKVNDYSFHQRELENQIINKESEFPLYDIRISPVLVNNYKCVDTSSVYYGDLVNIPMYLPVTVKPVASLTAEEQQIRNKFFHTDAVLTKAIQQPEVIEVEPIVDHQIAKPVEVAVQTANVVNPEDEAFVFHFMSGDQNPFKNMFGEVPLYYYNQYGSGTIIGFLSKKGFRKIMPAEYTKYAVPKYARDLLDDKDKLKNWFKMQYGQYYYAVAFH